MKKKMVIGIIVAVVLCGGYFIGSGFLRNGSVYMDGYSVSGDGRELRWILALRHQGGISGKWRYPNRWAESFILTAILPLGASMAGLGRKTALPCRWMRIRKLLGFIEIKTLIRKFCIRTRTVSGGGRRQTDKNNL